MLKKRQIYDVKPGSFKNLRLRTETLAAPLGNEVQVEVRAIGLNFADVFCVLGLYSAAPKERFIPGLEFSGVVRAVGKSVVDIKIGDKVMGVTRFGAYATMINIKSDYLLQIPTDWSFQEGSAYLVQVLTAYYGLKSLGSLQNGMNVLIHSAAGGVGIWSNRICRTFDCFTIGTIGHESKSSILKEEGYNRTIVRNRKEFKSQLTEALDGRPLHLIMESIGGSILMDGYHALAPMGRTVIFGSAHYGERIDRPNYPRLIWKYLHRPIIDPQAMIALNKSVMAFNLIYLFDHVQLMHRLLHEVGQFELGKPIIGGTYEFEELPDALRHFQSGKTIGKQVVNVQ